MLPLFSDGDRLLVWHCTRPKLGDAIVFSDDRRTYLKRVAAVPGETIVCWDMDYVLDDGEYYVLGDNLEISSDSRRFGPIHRDRVVGIAILKYYPRLTCLQRQIPQHPSLYRSWVISNFER